MIIAMLAYNFIRRVRYLYSNVNIGIASKFSCYDICFAKSLSSIHLTM